MKREHLISLLVVTLVLATFCGLGIWLLRPGLSPAYLAELTSRQNRPLLEISEPAKSSASIEADTKVRAEETEKIVQDVLARISTDLANDPVIIEALHREMSLWLDANLAVEAEELPPVPPAPQMAPATVDEASIVQLVDQRIDEWVLHNTPAIAERAGKATSETVSLMVHDAVVENMKTIPVELTEAQKAELADEVTARVLEQLTENLTQVAGPEVQERLAEYAAAGNDFGYVWGEPAFAVSDEPPARKEVPQGDRATYLQDRDGQREAIRQLVTERLKDF